MNSRGTTSLRSKLRLALWYGAVLATALLASPASAAEACRHPRLQVLGGLADHWRGPAERLCEMLGSMADADPSARLQLVPAGGDVIVEVTLGDGRATLRRVHPRDDLLLTVEALVAIPPVVPEVESTTVAPRQVAPPVVPAAAARPTMGVELGGGIVGRLAGSTLYLSIGISGYAAYRFESWLLGISARWDGYQTRAVQRPMQLEMSTAGGGLLLLHRVRGWDRIALEAGVTTWVLTEMQTRGEGERERGGNTFDVRMGAITRLTFGEHSLRGIVSLDAELSPLRLRHEERLADDLPLMPSWSLGLGTGISWSGSQ